MRKILQRIMALGALQAGAQIQQSFNRRVCQDRIDRSTLQIGKEIPVLSKLTQALTERCKAFLMRGSNFPSSSLVTSSSSEIAELAVVSIRRGKALPLFR